MIISLLGFTASLDFNQITSDFLIKNISGNGDNGKAMAFAFGGCTIYLIIGLIAILAIALIWRGIADWPLNQN